MKVYGAPDTSCILAAADAAGVHAEIRGRHVRLRPRENTYVRRTSKSTVVCYHGYVRFMAELLKRCDCQVKTVGGIYVNRRTFAQRMKQIAARNVGARGIKMRYEETCDCPMDVRQTVEGIIQASVIEWR